MTIATGQNQFRPVAASILSQLVADFTLRKHLFDRTYHLVAMLGKLSTKANGGEQNILPFQTSK